VHSYRFFLFSFESKCLTEEEVAGRKATVARLQRVVEDLFPNRKAQLQLFGSSVNGFGVSGSDMDMVLMLELDPKTDGNEKHPQANLVEKVGLVWFGFGFGLVLFCFVLFCLFCLCD
jgi:DNA polymerase sigma